jgi:hypothetical protein
VWWWCESHRLLQLEEAFVAFTRPRWLRVLEFIFDSVRDHSELGLELARPVSGWWWISGVDWRGEGGVWWIGERGGMRIGRWVLVLVVVIWGGGEVGLGDGAGCPMRGVVGRRALKQVAQPALQFGYYAATCPNVTQIVADRVNYWVLQNVLTPGKLLRLFFHDCVSAGCEGSILLNSTATVQAEKDAPVSATLEMFNVIDDIKAAVELQCPLVVSCADILALAAVNSVAQVPPTPPP